MLQIGVSRWCLKQLCAVYVANKLPVCATYPIGSVNYGEGGLDNLKQSQLPPLITTVNNLQVKAGQATTAHLAQKTEG